MPKSIKIPTLPIGTKFTYDGKTYMVVEEPNRNSCKYCAFYLDSCGCTSITTSAKLKRGNCNPYDRKDKKSVIYKEVTKENKDMGITNITLDIPKGYEIDTDNSDFNKGILKLRKKYITINDIIWISSAFVMGTNNPLTKIKAIAQLMDIAHYYNGDWKPFTDNNPNYAIMFNPYTNEYDIDVFFSNRSGCVYFKNKKDAQAVIDNPNFRDILDTIYKD